jgi:hypothetical protein
VNWVNERLVVVEDATAGMVWAPEAIWDPAKGTVIGLEALGYRGADCIPRAISGSLGVKICEDHPKRALKKGVHKRTTY